MQKIYIVEDDKNIAEIEQFALKNAGYSVEIFKNAKDFEEKIKAEYPDLVILDVMLPDRDGLSILRDLRTGAGTAKIPIIMVTAKTTEMDKVKGLDQGADDYITKPFELAEVLARIQVQLRHAGRDTESREIVWRDMILDRNSYQISIGGKEIQKITRQEFAILELLVSHPKQVFSKEDIFSYAWDEPYMGETKTLDVHISNIRKKIKAVTEDEYIETVWGIGYRIHG